MQTLKRASRTIASITDDEVRKLRDSDQLEPCIAAVSSITFADEDSNRVYILVAVDDAHQSIDRKARILGSSESGSRSDVT